jgi:2-methylisocitrate lyase-like PEP mutase family enzyme
MLLLPCAWDVASSKIFELQGFKAIGTTSAGVAAVCGRADGQKLEFREYLKVIRRIAASAQVPITVDIEGGYATTVAGIAANVKAVLRAGAVGINIEDENHTRRGGHPLEPTRFVVEKIRAIRAMSERCGISIFINAKTDAIWLGVGNSPAASFREAVRRANAYGAAGADCVFVPGNFGLRTIASLVKLIQYPLNIVAKKNTPPVPTLRRIGVKRLSMGSGPMRAAMGLTRKIAQEALSIGTFELCFNLAIPYVEVRSMFNN